jgi:CheY-like chemotaxis protein
MLLVEDDPGSVYLIRRYADRAGCQLLVTAEAGEALALAHAERPALALVSDRPGATGLEIVRGLEGNPATRHIPVFLCSTSDAAPPRWRDEVDGYLVKPVMYEDFVNMLAEAGVQVGRAEAPAQDAAHNP